MPDEAARLTQARVPNLWDGRKWQVKRRPLGPCMHHWVEHDYFGGTLFLTLLCWAVATARAWQGRTVRAVGDSEETSQRPGQKYAEPSAGRPATLRPLSFQNSFPHPGSKIITIQGEALASKSGIPAYLKTPEFSTLRPMFSPPSMYPKFITWA